MSTKPAPPVSYSEGLEVSIRLARAEAPVLARVVSEARNETWPYPGDPQVEVECCDPSAQQLLLQSIDFDIPPKNHDHTPRRVKRSTKYHPAEARLSDTLIIPCQTRDLSELGAELVFEARHLVHLPTGKEFILGIHGFHPQKARVCGAVRRTESILAGASRIGVEFKDVLAPPRLRERTRLQWSRQVRADLNDPRMAERRKANLHAIVRPAAPPDPAAPPRRGCTLVDISEVGAQIEFQCRMVAEEVARWERVVLSVPDKDRDAEFTCSTVQPTRHPRHGDAYGARLGLKFEPPVLLSEVIEHLSQNRDYLPPEHHVILIETGTPIPDRSRATVVPDGKRFLHHLFHVFERSHPFENILRRLISRGCRKVVVEWGHESADDGSTFESYAHRRYRSGLRSARLLFYATEGEGGETSERLQGSTTIRPSKLLMGGPHGIQLGHVGRTILGYMNGKPGELHGKQESGDLEYFLMAAPYRIVHPALGEERIRTVEYRQQSIMSGSCAHAAIEMAAGFLHKRFGTRRLQEEDVRRHASWSGQRGAIVDDLVDHEIAVGIGLTGFNPRVYSRRVPKTPDAAGITEALPIGASLPHAIPVGIHTLANVLHLAIDSSLPAILVLGARQEGGRRHAVVAVGHTSIPKGPAMQSREIDRRGIPGRRPAPSTTTAWARDVIVHDDAIGPYLELPIRAVHMREQPAPNHASTEDLNWLWRRSIQTDLEKVIVPLPPQVALEPAIALERANVHFQRLRQRLNASLLDKLEASSGVTPEHASKICQRDNDDVVLSAMLVEGVQFRRSALKSLQLAGQHANERQWAGERVILETIALPSYVYVLGLCSRASIEEKGPFRADTYGFLVLDAMAACASQDILLLVRLAEYISFTCPRSGVLHQTLVPFLMRTQTGMHDWDAIPMVD
ncbi:MAG: hypothetical protein H6834_17055 [Planctomycetes bacterium]|nr:hypothetical protein [Planctomycetota bacterium]